ncbi:hypothetical protein QBC41DRAFT_284699 [Cercophora samala]|uniref:Uncharacterized protein n=1 Tax=Cercophora samala TaxID=330535 RepID=A0AA39Z3G2_9PEZI|nr:hypothetical protein QBC41DRAFT_284699 [Cercophora samala]
MSMMDSEDVFFCLENRLASFQVAQPASKGRTSNANSRGPKPLQWPHKTLSPVAFAKAGFFFEPYPQSPDNVVCFLCDKSLDGWEEHDNPLEEHLKHSPTCGWAIMAAIEAGMGNYGKVHPLDPFMVEARKATFAGRWPYENKKGFKCKTKKLVEAGWKYTPSREAEDMATCAYCQLALEGWESEDNPWDEHHNRAPECPFFTLINSQPAPKKSGRAKAARPSKASRLSVQSIATIATAASDLTSVGDLTLDQDDSVMTTASTMAQGAKKTAKGRKATTAKGRKTKAKKEEAIEILEDEPQVEAPPPKPARGRKRSSDTMEDPSMINTEAPAPKKRATRTKKGAAVEPPAMEQDVDMVDVIEQPPPPAKKKGRGSTTKSRKVSQASAQSQPSNVPDDDEIERQLEADLERYDEPVAEEPVAEELVAEEPIPTEPVATEPVAAEPEMEAPRPKTKGRPKKSTTARKTSQAAEDESRIHPMFDATPAQPDEAEIDAEYKALLAEVDPEPVEPEEQEIIVPKKGRKTGTRKTSKTKKAKEPTPPSEPADESVEDSAPSTDSVQYPDLKMEEAVAEPEAEPVPEPIEADPDASTGTIVTQPAKRGRGRPSKKSLAERASLEARASLDARASIEDIEPAPAPRRSSARIVKARESVASAKATPEPAEVDKKSTKAPTPPPAPVVETARVPPTPVRTNKSLPPPPPSSASQHPSTPRTQPSRRAKQATTSPSPSPQSSDAENTQPSLTKTTAVSVVSNRVALAPVVVATPSRNSPSKRATLGGLQSATPWQATDLEMVFSPSSNANKENGVSRLLSKGRDLTSPEKGMTVEEWIYHNAELAEQMLKAECEHMVSTFEREGTRAMRVLEGLIVE